MSRLGSTCSELNIATRPNLFRDVRWPHRRLSKVDSPKALPFLPETTWSLIHDLHFDWPEEWPDMLTNPAETDHPDIFKRLDEALPKIPNLKVFSCTIPFDPPRRTLNILFEYTAVQHLRMIDTPLTKTPLLNEPHKVEALTLVPVAEAMRMGEGPFNGKMREMQYFSRPYRQQHRGVAMWFAGEIYLKDFRHVKYLQVSLQFVWHLGSLSSEPWPELETLILTGTCGAKNIGSMIDVVYTMPKLRDLRILLAKKIGHGPDDDRMSDHHIRKPTILSSIKSLSLSNSYGTEIFLRNASSVERLSISAILKHPQIPIGMKSSELDKALKDLEISGGNKSLKKIRLMTEDELTVAFFRKLGQLCPNLEFVEIERCGYQEGEVGFEWSDYGEVFSEYRYLQELRIGIPFADCEEDCTAHSDHKECIRSDRQDFAIHLASWVPTLLYVGFEYRTRTGKYRKEDRWLDYEIIRSSKRIHLTELAPTWYEIPEVWERTLLHD
ncbi:hypothetical protein CPB83DRAFT_761305 [Crepidotus variabilis]|uniref:Uncharacterized protein n=1 Tax=Crepidotus variabilis TaxID=179855 RepID=A0A9P6JT28_9AGAR|nr:hypothetical protein CPB83DRAFT_761305 [Crepidotus variabilis]